MSSLINLCGIAINASLEAGKAILRHYNGKYSVEYKEDKSPLTSADNTSHKIIVDCLKNTNIPILSEEGRLIPYEERKKWKRFWLVDPLDGTKEFINHNGEFTVNIALIEESRPVIGIIYVPVSYTLYFAIEIEGSFRLILNSSDLITLPTNDFMAYRKSADKLPLHEERPVTIVGSRSHQNPENIRLINSITNHYTNFQVVNAGSSLKFCRIAEGSADYYPRIGPTMEWDTAAGDAIARFSGAMVMQYNSDTPLRYNKENLLNPDFLVVSEKHYSIYNKIDK